MLKFKNMVTVYTLRVAFATDILMLRANYMDVASGMTLASNRQMKAARALLGWEQSDISVAAEVSIGTIRRMEGLDGPIRGQHETVRKVERAFEKAGIRFLENGVQLKSSPAADDA